MFRLWLVLCGVLVCVQGVYADAEEQPSWRAEIDVSYSEANPDYKPFSNGEGVALHAVAFWHNWQVFGRLAEAEFQPSGEVAGGTMKDWWALGLGYERPITERWSVRGRSAFQGLTRKRSTTRSSEQGYEFAVGAGFSPTQAWQFYLDVGVMDVLIDDWSLSFEGRYRMSERVYLVARLRDYADFDLTYYEGGIGLRF